MRQAHGAVQMACAQSGAVATIVIARDDQLYRAGAGTDQLKTVRLNQGRRDGYTDGQRKPCQHAPAKQAGGNAAKGLQGHG